VKHASNATLQSLAALLDEIRKRSPLKEKKLGIFYLKSRSFLHFHEIRPDSTPTSARERISIGTP
jgi:hypothetical protein